MTPGRFRRRLSEDCTDVLDERPKQPNPERATSRGKLSWLGGQESGSTRSKLPWLSPRERRHPLRDMRLSCFRSYLSPGVTANGTSNADDSLMGADGSSRNSSPKSPKSPTLGIKSRSPSRSPTRSSKSPSRSSRSCKSNENVYYVNSQGADVKTKGTQSSVCLGARLRALSARCLALVHADRPRKAHISGRNPPCKQRSFSSGALPGLHDFQRRQQLNPIFREDSSSHTQAHPSSTNTDREEDGDSGILVSEPSSVSPGGTALSSLPGTGRDSMSWARSGSGTGTRNAWATSSAASRALRSASLDRELLSGTSINDLDENDINIGTSEQDHEALSNGAANGEARRSRASTKSSSSSSEISEIFSRFQRRRVAGNSGVSPTRSSRPGLSSPPLLPAPPQRPSLGGGASRRVFHFVRLIRSQPTEELGIFIAKSEAPDQGAQGYIVAHIVPGGLAHRDGQLRLGDELVVVNGKQLRGLTMAAARHRLRAGPVQVDLVIARPVSFGHCRCGSGADVAVDSDVLNTSSGRDSGLDVGLDGGLDTSGDSDPAFSRSGVCNNCRLQQVDHLVTPNPRTLQESSVDYENVVLSPRLAMAGSAAEAGGGEVRKIKLASQEATAGAEPANPSDSPVTATTGSLTVPPTSTDLSESSSPGLLRKQHIFQKHSSCNKAARRSLALVTRSASPPHETLAETQHHSLKRRGKDRRGGRAGDGVSTVTDFQVELRKGPGCRALGFTVVGGADSPRGSLPIFVRSVLQGGQASQDGRLQPGDELLSLNGHTLRGATHAEAVAMFRAVRTGPVVLNICRRTSKKAQSCSDLVVDRGSEQEGQQDED